MTETPKTRVVDLQIAVFGALDDLCGSLTPAEWDRDTDCPGWTVKDNLSHIVGTEEMLLGREAPSHEVAGVDDLPHIHNPIGASNEIQVDYRRPWPPERVLENFREVVAERTAALRGLAENDLAADSWTPVGPGTLHDLIAIRIMDCWVHEQDIRRATGKPGGLEGPVANHAFKRHAQAIPFVVGKKAGAPDGSTVVIEVEGQEPFAVGVDGKRASALPEVPAEATVRLAMDLDTFNRLCCGRGDQQVNAKGVRIDGDAALGARIVDQMNFMI